MKEVLVEVLGPFIAPFSGAMVIILREGGTSRVCGIEVGGLEGQMISVYKCGCKTRRPMTHELAAALVKDGGGVIEKVVVTEFIDEIYRARIFTKWPDGKTTETDSRPSDAVALAFKLDCPVYVNAEFLMEEPELSAAADHGIKMADSIYNEPGNIKDEDKLKRWLESLNPDSIPKA